MHSTFLSHLLDLYGYAPLQSGSKNGGQPRGKVSFTLTFGLSKAVVHLSGEYWFSCFTAGFSCTVAALSGLPHPRHTPMEASGVSMPQPRVLVLEQELTLYLILGQII